jgi:DNA-binding transcriptional LysR family regulator
MDATSVHNSILTKIGTEELPRSGEIQNLLDALRDAAQGIRGTDLEIAENRRILQATTVPELTPKVLQTIQDAAPVIDAITEGELQEEMREDIAVLADYDGELSGVRRRDSFGHDEIVRVTGRLSRIYSALKKTPDLMKKIEDNPVIKLTGSVTVIVGAISSVIAGIGWLFSFL